MRKFDLTKDAFKFVKSLDAKQFLQVLNKISELTHDPRPTDSIQMKGSHYFRTDIGEHRIIYTYDGSMVNIAVIGKRNDDDAYKQIKRK